jgi:hypothetical protein
MLLHIAFETVIVASEDDSGAIPTKVGVGVGVAACGMAGWAVAKALSTSSTSAAAALVSTRLGNATITSTLGVEPRAGMCDGERSSRSPDRAVYWPSRHRD